MLDDAQSFFGMKDRDQITPDRRAGPDPSARARRPRVVAARRRQARRGRGAELRVRDWREMNKNLFCALKLERIATFIILSLAILVASFCIVCTLLLMVTEKGKEIAILKALGASRRRHHAHLHDRGRDHRRHRHGLRRRDRRSRRAPGSRGSACASTPRSITSTGCP